MTGQFLHRLVLHARIAVVALACAVTCGIGHAQEQAVANIIVTNDSAGIATQGTFQRFSANLTRSRAPLLSQGAGSHHVTFNTGIPVAGYYRVFVWWPQVRLTLGEADVTVHSASGESTVTLDQGLRTGQWVPVGIFQFANDAAISVGAGAGKSVVVDAVRLQYMGPQRPALAFETDALPIAASGDAYVGWFDLIGGTGPYTFAADPNTLPPGLVLDASNGFITGVATTVGSFQFDVEAFDRSGQRTIRAFTIDVVRGARSADKHAVKTNGGIQTTGDASAKPSASMTAKDGVAAGATPDLSNLLGVLASIPEGEWVRVNLNNYSDVWTPADQRPLYGWGNPAPWKILAAWSSVAWDPNRGDLWLFGGGHANYPGNDVYRWRGSTQKWERASLPSEIKQDDLGNWQAVDGWDAAPASAHTYDNNMFFPHIDRLVAFGGAAFNSGAAWRRELTPTTSRLTGPFFFNPSLADANKVGGTTGSQVQRVAGYSNILGGNMWANRDMFVNIPNFPVILSQVSGCTAYADENGKDVAYIGARSGGGTNTNLYKYTVSDLSNPALDTFQQVGVFWNGTSGNTTCALDPVRKLFVRTGSNSVPFVYWSLAAPGINNKDIRMTPVDPTGEFATLLSTNAINIYNCGFDFDPQRSRFDLWCGDGRVWALTPPDSGAATGWTIVKQPAPALATPNGDVGTGILGKWKYVSNIDAFIGVQDSTLGNIWLYKPVGWNNPSGGGTSPTAPTGVSASDGTSTSNVIVTWNTVPNTTSYTVFRSTVNGSQGAQIGTTTSTTFTDITPTPGTIYYYGVTATTAGGVSSLSAQDSGYAAAVISGGSLTGTASLPSTVNLTAVGTADWVHWLPLNRKQSAGLISDYTAVGSGVIQSYSSDPRAFTWTDGSPTASGSDTSGATVSGVGNGFTFSVPAGTASRTLIIYVGGSNSVGKLTAHLSDASAPDFIDTSLSGSGRYDGFYTLDFHAASGGQKLQITWTQLSGSGSISLQGAALQ